jgi:hypothetical protein
VAVDWSQFQPVAASPQGVDWGQFQPVEDAGPPEASFRGVRADSASTATPTTSPLGQFVSALKAVPGQIATGAQALVQGGDYPTDPSDQRRVLGVGEGMLRDAADIAAGWANAAYQWSPMGVAERTAQHIVSQFGGPTLPTMANVAEAGTEAAHSVAGIDENTMRFQSPRMEAAARFVPELLSNLVPVGGAAHEADTLLRAGERAVTAEAVAGVHGPEAQGTAVADQLLKGAGDLSITPEMRVPAEVPDVPVPDAALDAPAQGAGEAALPAGEPVPVQAAPAERPPGGPDLGVAAAEPGAVEESTRASQPVAQSEPDVLSHEDIDAMVSQGQLSPETAAQLKGMVSREETAQVPGQHRTIAGEVPEPAWARATVARDADGTPATVYRGSRSGTTTPENFNELGAATGHPSAHLGVWFSESAADAGKYGTISEHHLDLRNPKVYDAADFPGFDSPEEAIAFRKQLQSEGHDGVIVDARPYGGPRQFIALEPHQVIHPVEEEASHASSLRESAGQADLGREVPAGGEVGIGRDLQFPREQEPHPLPQRLRQGREGPSEPVQAPLGPTGIKKAALAEERPGFNWEATTAHLRRSDPQAYERARTAFEKNPNHGVDLANSIAEKPRPISKEEVLALNMDRARIRNERNTAYAEAEKAINEGDTATAAAWRARVDRLDEEFARNDVAAAHSGHETAEGLRSRQLMTNDDYTMAGAVRRMTVKKGEKLTTEEQGNIERLAKEHEAAERIAAADKPARVKVAQSKFDSLAEQLRKAPRRVLCEVA